MHSNEEFERIRRQYLVEAAKHAASLGYRIGYSLDSFGIDTKNLVQAKYTPKPDSKFQTLASAVQFSVGAYVCWCIDLGEVPVQIDKAISIINYSDDPQEKIREGGEILSQFVLGIVIKRAIKAIIEGKNKKSEPEPVPEVEPYELVPKEYDSEDLSPSEGFYKENADALKVIGESLKNHFTSSEQNSEVANMVREIVEDSNDPNITISQPLVNYKAKKPQAINPSVFVGEESDEKRRGRPKKQEPREINSSKYRVAIGRPSYKLTDDLITYVTTRLFDPSKMEFIVHRNDAVIHHARNIIADKFLKSNCDWLLFWDDDIIPSIGDPNWIRENVTGVPRNYDTNYLLIDPIEQLISRGKHIIGGVYYGRTGKHGPVLDAESGITKAPANRVLPVKWIGTGFLLIHRDVFDAIRVRHPELAGNPDSKNPWEQVFNYFEPNIMQAEDVSFCHRAGDAGFTVYADLAVTCFHLGQTAFGPWDFKAKDNAI